MPKAYLRDGFNALDLAIVVCSLLSLYAEGDSNQFKVETLAFYVYKL